MTPPIHLYNTLTRAKEPLRTERPDRVTMYVCGPTVYNYAHIGNARPALVFDVLACLLRRAYPRVVYARNFTDVDDRINAAATVEGVAIGTITARYIDAYHEDMRDLLAQAPGEAIRLALLSTHYRHPLDWNAERLASARKILARFYAGLEKVEAVTATPGVLPDETVLAALNNDLNVPGAIASLHRLLAVLENADTDAARAQAKARLLASAGPLGLLQQVPHEALEALKQTAPGQPRPSLSTGQIEALIAEREQARRQREFARADALRDELAGAGVLVQDTPQGSTWTLAEENPA
jgi:cysteinyl-tRNA synthetase